MNLLVTVSVLHTCLPGFRGFWGRESWLSGSYHVRSNANFGQDSPASASHLEIVIWRKKCAMSTFQWTPSGKPPRGVKTGKNRSIFAPPPEMGQKWPVFTFWGPAEGLGSATLFPQRLTCENGSSGPRTHGKNVGGDSRTKYKVWRRLSPFPGLEKDRKAGETCKNRVISVCK